MGQKPFKLPRKFAQEWLEALRSGDYEQYGGSLVERVHNEKNELIGFGGYCCLGVACKVEEIDDEHLSGDFISEEMFDTFPDIPKELVEGSPLSDILPALNDGLSKSKKQSLLNRYQGIQFLDESKIAKIGMKSLVKNDSGEYVNRSFKTEQYSFKQIADWIELNVKFY